MKMWSCLMRVGAAVGLLVGTGMDLLAEAGKAPRRSRPAPVVSPLFHEDGSVTFQIKAPAAQEVILSGEMHAGKLALTKGEEGIWSVTLEQVEPGLYGYNFQIDGVRMLDPGNPELKPSRAPRTSILQIPGNHSYDFLDVPHGTVHEHGYRSAAIDRYREMRVYTPPGYESGEEKYPLLVLQHGHSDNHATWTTYGKAHWILDNLIAGGRARPMIVAMLDGHPVPGSFGNGRSPENVEELRSDLLTRALPFLEERYRILPGRKNRAIAGLSMGGLHALSIGLTEQDTFAWIGAFSAAVPQGKSLEEVLSGAKGGAENRRLLWIACGKKDRLLDENETFVSRLREQGTDHQWKLTEGGHSWPVWRDYLAEFAPLLFQSARGEEDR